jgi:uncharacterized protein (DUF2141 family)
MNQSRRSIFESRMRDAVWLGAVLLSTYCSGVFLSGCGGGSAQQPPPISITVSASVRAVEATGTSQVTATVINDAANKGVTWTVSCSATACGSVSPTSTASGTATTYTAPATPPNANLSVTLTATSVSDPTKSASALIGVLAITVSVAPQYGSAIDAGQSESIAASVSNDPGNRGVTWTISPATGAGTLSSVTTTSVTYNAPPVPLASSVEATITATSVTDPTKTSPIMIFADAIRVKISESASLINVTGSVAFQGGAAFDPNNAGVTWSIAGCIGGASVCGSITNINNSGPYTATYAAPAAVPPGGQVSVVATSITDPTKSATAMVSISPINFTSQNYPAGNSPSGVVVADFNGDGKLDIAVADNGDPSTGDNGGVSILLGNGDGTFQPAKLVSAGKNPISLVVGDFNNDGKQDLLVTDEGDRSTGGNGSISLLLGNGDGTFQAPITLSAGSEPASLVVGDFNGDGNLDFAVTDANSGVYVFLGNGDGTFKTPTLIQTGNAPIVLVAHDFNGDGKLDLAVAGSPLSDFESSVSVLLGNGDGTFAKPVLYTTDEALQTSIAAGDLNGDGKADLAVTSFECTFGFCNSDNLMLLGNGDGTFQPLQGILSNHSTSAPFSAHIGDVTGSGKSDLVEVWGRVFFGPCMCVLPGNGDGTFQGVLSFAADQGPFAVAIGDFNGDGKPDIVVANLQSNDVTVFLNASVP